MPKGEPKFGVYNIPAEQFELAVKALTAYRVSVDPGRCSLCLRFGEGLASLTLSTKPQDAHVRFGKGVEFSGAQVTIDELGIEAEPTETKGVPDIGFDGRYLLDIIKTVRARGAVFVQFHYFDYNGPALLRALDKSDTAYFVLMPVRI